MPKLITAKVAKILNSYELAINAGENVGIHLGMKFSVMNPLGENIIDPDTGEELGSVSKEKVRVVVTKVEDNFSIAESCSSDIIEDKDRVADLSNLAVFGYTPRKRVRRSFKAPRNSHEYSQQNEGFVEVGDIVEQVQENDVASEKNNNAEDAKVAATL